MSYYTRPQPESYIEGNNTFITNINIVCGFIDRPAVHFAKYLMCYNIVVLTKRISSFTRCLELDGKIEEREISYIFANYVNDYVSCHCRCCKAFTSKMTDESNVTLIECSECKCIRMAPLL